MKSTFFCFLLCACSANIMQSAPLQSAESLRAVLDGLMNDIDNLIQCKVKMDAEKLRAPSCISDECLHTAFSYFVNQTLLLKPADDHKDCPKNFFARIRNVQRNTNQKASDPECLFTTDSSSSSTTDDPCVEYHEQPKTFLKSFYSVLQQMYRRTIPETS